MDYIVVALPHVTDTKNSGTSSGVCSFMGIFVCDIGRYNDPFMGGSLHKKPLTSLLSSSGRAGLL